MDETTHELWWFVVSCSPHLYQGEQVELFEKLKQ